MARLRTPPRNRAKGFLELIEVWFRTHVTRIPCRRNGHQGSWAVITGNQGQPILGSCKRCLAIGEFDLHSRRLYFD